MGSRGWESVVSPTALPRVSIQWRDGELIAGTTTRELDFGPVESTNGFDKLSEWAAGRFTTIVSSRQRHGASLLQVDDLGSAHVDSRRPVIERVDGFDGMYTSRRGVMLTIGIADCVPVFLYSPEEGVICLLHAGWRGVAAEILLEALGALERNYGLRPADLSAYWGPSIGECCYPVGEEVVEAIRQTSAGPDVDAWVATTEDTNRVDLRIALRSQAIAGGLSSSAILASQHCTSCEHELFHSYRRDGRGWGRMVAFAGLPIVTVE